MVDINQSQIGAEQDLNRAREILARPEPWRGLAAPADLAEGILAIAKSNWPGAEGAFDRDRETEQSLGFPYNEARVLVGWAEMCRKRDAAGDRERARKFLREGLEIYHRCAAKKDVEAALMSL